MKSKFFTEAKKGFIFFSVIYAITTIVSSSLQMLQGQPTDTNFHILNRAAIVFIAVITITLFDKIHLKSKILSYLVPYAISMAIVFIYVWLTGFVESLHPDAYRDIFLNFTAIAICVMAVIFIKDKFMEKKIKSREKAHNV